ncbi:MAG: amidohydrolase family protein [Clostridia bacterium]|nr:amidohydrolase family protein [Clostridia bacterium]
MSYAFTDVSILNGHSDMTPVKGKAVLVCEDKIVDIVDENAIPANYEKISLGGKYLMPGLINLHVHLPSSGRPMKTKPDYRKVELLMKLSAARAIVRVMCRNYAKLQLFSGTTTVRAVGGILDVDSCLRDSINAGKAVGPRILAANYAVSVDGGHMTGSVAKAAHSAGEAAAMVRDISKSHPDLIKLMITGGVLDAEVPGEPGVLKMPAEYVKAACDEAHRLGFKVAAHAEGNEGMLVALQNGVDTIEHGGKPSEEVIRLFKEKGAVLVGTLSPALPFVFMDKSVTGMTDTDLINGKALFENMKECINECLKNGITVGLGTDTGCPFITHYDTWRELYWFTKFCGVDNAFALHTATEINARIAGIDGITGTVEAGKSADFLISDGNPLEDLTTLKQPAAVVFRGKIYDRPKIKKYDFVEKQLGKIM